jgi:hypothetical protein
MKLSAVRETQRVARGKYIARSLGIGGVAPRKHSRVVPTERVVQRVVQRVAANAPTVVAHPAGCPRVAFCGCGAAVRVFGHPVRDLWLAANWFKFPRASLAPGTVAVKHHHVFVVEQVLGNGMVLAYDANSGGHATRIHMRSVAGYTIVQPRG